jgi:hypothetical protein
MSEAVFNISEQKKQELLALTPIDFLKRQLNNLNSGKITQEAYNFICQWYWQNKGKQLINQATTKELDLVEQVTKIVNEP